MIRVEKKWRRARNVENHVENHPARRWCQKNAFFLHNYLEDAIFIASGSPQQPATDVCPEKAH